MSFTPDSKYLLLSYGGKINKIDVEAGISYEIPFGELMRLLLLVQNLNLIMKSLMIKK